VCYNARERLQRTQRAGEKQSGRSRAKKAKKSKLDGSMMSGQRAGELYHGRGPPLYGPGGPGRGRGPKVTEAERKRAEASVIASLMMMGSKKGLPVGGRSMGHGLSVSDVAANAHFGVGMSSSPRLPGKLAGKNSATAAATAGWFGMPPASGGFPANPFPGAAPVDTQQQQWQQPLGPAGGTGVYAQTAASAVYVE
jgi:hypothetical protein